MRVCIVTLTACLSFFCVGFNQANAQTNGQTNVVAFWHFDGYDFRDDLDLIPADSAGRFSIAAEDGDLAVDAGSPALASLEVFLGDASELDGNGGGGFVPYTSPVSGSTYGTTRTVRFNDLQGGGDDFSIGGVDVFQIDDNNGDGALPDDFGNDALIYLSLDGSGYQDFELRFDLEGTPTQGDTDDLGNPITVSSLPESFDLFYRTTGPGGTWFRDQSNFDLSFSDLDPNTPDPDNQIADTGFFSLNAALDNSSQIEIIINDFDRGDGNNELELDNFEIVANVVGVGVPEPASATLLLLAGLGLVSTRRRS